MVCSSLAIGSEVVSSNQSLCKKAEVRLSGIFLSPAPSPSGDGTVLALLLLYETYDGLVDRNLY